MKISQGTVACAVIMYMGGGWIFFNTYDEMKACQLIISVQMHLLDGI